jgi:hypothetical protein
MRGGGVGAAEPDLGTPDSNNSTSYASMLFDPDKLAEVSFNSDQVLLKMAPAELRRTRDGSRHAHAGDSGRE